MAKAISKTQTRKRRTLKQRAGRTYYGISKDGTVLYRFANHTQRLAVIQASGNKITEIGALDFRNMLAEDVDGKLTIKDERQTPMPAEVQTAAPPTPDGTATPPVITLESIAAAVAQALLPILGQQVREGPQSGEQPRASRLVASH